MPPPKSRAQVTTPPPTSTHDVELADSFPIPTSKRLIAIEHPAILSSADAGVKSLGGNSALAKAFDCPLGWQTSQNKDVPRPTLELRFRPDDRYQHPIVSQPVKVQNIVVKVEKNKQNEKIEDIEVVGVVDTVLRFRGDHF